MKKSLLLMLFLALTWCWTAQAETLTFDFEDGKIPSEWTNDATYPWVAVETDPASTAGHYIKSSNEGVGSSTSSISASFNFVGDGSISFDGGCWGEGTSTAWDKCIFEIDGVQQFAKGEANPRWENYSYIVEAGTHTFTWKYSKDSSVNPTGDAFFLGNVVVDLGVAAACPKPTNISASEISSSQATITWVSESSDFEIVWSDDADFDPNAVTATSVSAKSYTITGLDALTNYYVYVRTICESENSEWSNKFSFTTTCGAEAIPYSYGFETVDDFSCWTSIAGAAIDNTSSNVHSGSKYLKFSGTTSNMIALPEFSAPTNTLRVEFWTRPESTGGSSGKFSVGYMTDITDVNTFVAIETYNSSEMTTSYVKKIIDFNDAPANAHIALRQFDCSTYYYWYVDDITVKEIPSCLAPTGLNADNITTSSADLSWTEGGSESEWIIYYKKSGEDSFTEVANVTENPYTLESLDASSTYQFYVKAVCSATEESEASDIASFATACDAIVIDADHPYSENFDNCDASTSYTPSANYLPGCWNYINECTYSSYKWYPVVDSYSSSYAHSGSKYLKFYSYYSSSWSDYDPQPQYAVLPQMDDLDSKQLVLYARGYNASSSIIIGRMSDPADVSTFSQIAEQTLTATYAEYEFNLAGVDGDYIAIKIDAASSDRTSNGAYIDDIVVREAPSCIKPSNLAVDASGLTATLSWVSEDGNFSIAHATSAEADPDENVLPEGVSDNSYVMSDLALGNHYFWVRTDCSDTEHSEWAGPVSVHIGYCEPNPSSVDGNGISNVTFGLGDKVVNHNTEKATYTDCSDQIGAVQAGVESTIAITYVTGYTYGTIIWVDLNKDLAFEENEILYTGTSTDDNPTTLNATITIPATQDVGDYRMRIGGADSGFDSYIGGSSTTAPNPCYTGSYAVFQDYTLRVLEAPSCLIPTGLEVTYNGGTEATISWSSEATAWNMNVNGTPINAVITNPYTLTGLELATTYAIEVQADCGDATSDWTNAVSFTTDLCMPEDQCLITFELTDSWGDGWNGAAIRVVDVETSTVLGELSNENLNEITGSGTNELNVKTLSVCNGREIQFIWIEGNYDTEASYVVKDVNGQVIFEGSGAMAAPVNYTVDCTHKFYLEIGTSGYATFYDADYAYTMPANLSGHIFNATTGLSDAIYEANQIIPAKEPLVMKAADDVVLPETFVLVEAETDALPSAGNDLQGNNEEGIIGSATDGNVYYVLSLNAAGEDESVGFYYMLENGVGGFIMPAHKAYLKYAAASAPSAFFLFNGENGATWLENLQGVEGSVKFWHNGNIYILRDSIIYDATGRKVRELK